MVDAHGPLPAADLIVLAGAGAVALGLAVLVEVGLRTTAPALVAVLGSEELVTLAIFGAFLNVHREQSKDEGPGYHERWSTTAKRRSRWGRRDEIQAGWGALPRHLTIPQNRDGGAAGRRTKLRVLLCCILVANGHHITLADTWPRALPCKGVL